MDINIDKYQKRLDTIASNKSSESEIREVLDFYDKEYSRKETEDLFDSIPKTLYDNNIIQSQNSDLKDYEYNRSDYDKSPKKLGGDGGAHRTKRNEYLKGKILENGQVIDEYTGEQIDVIDADVDEINSRKYMHDNGLKFGSDKRKAEVGSQEENFAVTHKSNNRSKKDKSLTLYANENGLDKRRTNPRKKNADKHIPNNIAIVGDVVKDVGVNSLKGGGVFAAHEFVNEFIAESTTTMKFFCIEIKCGKKRDFQEKLTLLKAHFHNMKINMMKKWKNFLKNFVKGFLTKLLSNIVNIILSFFKNIYRAVKNIIKFSGYGLLSLFNAFKLIVNPPDKMTRGEAFHEASKIIVTTVSLAGSIIAGESINSWIIGLGIPFADIITVAIQTVIGIIVSLLAVFIVNKIDFFNVMKNKKNEFMNKRLEEKIKNTESEYYSYLDEIKKELRT